MDAHYRIRNWTTFQHYKHRSPPWIKFHRTLLDDEKFHRLPDRAAKLLVLAWLLASEAEGVLPASHEIAWRLRLASTEVHEDMKTLVALGFVELASGVLAECLQPASDLLYQSRVETEAEKEKEKNPSGSKRKTALSDEWEPVEAHRVLGQDLGVDVDSEAEKFKDYCRAHRKLYIDWGAAFRNWLRNAKQFSNGNGRPNDEQAVADVLYAYEKVARLHDGPPGEIPAKVKAELPVHWQRSGSLIEQMKWGTIGRMSPRDRDQEVRLRVRQLRGVV